MKFKWFCVMTLALLMIVPALADEVKTKKRNGKKGQRRGMASQLIKRLDEVKLTDDQVAKINELGKQADVKAKEIRDQAGLTPQLMKKHALARKSFSNSELKGKELAAAIFEKADFSEEQAKAIKEINGLRAKMNKGVFAMLTDEQKELAPKQMKRAGKNRGNKKKRNKNQ